MVKVFYGQKNHRWIDILSQLVENYNNQINRSIKEEPANVDVENKHLIWMRLFGNEIGEIPKPKFQKGDLVRVLDFVPRDEKMKELYKEKHPAEINPKTEKKNEMSRCTRKTRQGFQMKFSLLTKF